MTNEDIAVKLTEHHKEIGSLKHRVDDLQEMNQTTQELAISVKELATNMQHMLKEQERQNKVQEQAIERINILEEKPAQRWDSLTTVVITAIASGIITYFLTNVLH